MGRGAYLVEMRRESSRCLGLLGVDTVSGGVVMGVGRGVGRGKANALGASSAEIADGWRVRPSVTAAELCGEAQPLGDRLASAVILALLQTTLCRGLGVW